MAKTPSFLPLEMNEERLKLVIQITNHAVQSAGLGAITESMLDLKNTLDSIVIDAREKGLIPEQ
ncbi:MAG: hypothetical protein ACK4FG_01950 [Brevundimonas sp.]